MICNQIKNYLINEDLENAVNFPIQDSSELKGIAIFLKLADNLGAIHRSTAEGPIREVHINCFGSVDKIKPIAPIIFKKSSTKKSPKGQFYKC